MNPNTQPYGFFGFPSKNDYNSLYNVKEFFSSGTYEIITAHTFLTIILVSGGMGGGSGASKASGVAAYGGNGGMGGSVVTKTFFIKDLIKYGYILDIEIGSGGNGGTAVNTTDANGKDGSPGGVSRIKFSGSSIYFMNARTYPARTGNTGNGGTNVEQSVEAGIRNTSDFYGLFEGKLHGFMAGRPTAGLTTIFAGGQPRMAMRPAMAVGGGSKNTSNQYSSGIYMDTQGFGSIIVTGSWRNTQWGYSGITNMGVNESATGGNIPRRSLVFPNWNRTGVPGAASSTTATAGGDGFLGSGGAGGGGTINGGTSGAGGKGGNGHCILISRG